MPPDCKETKLGSSNEDASPSAVKDIGIALVAYRAWKCIPTAISSGVNISDLPGSHLLQKMSSQ